MAKGSITDRWNNFIERNLLIQFIDVVLRGCGQVMFQNNPLTGLLFFIAIFIGGYSENLPQTGYACLLATACATLTAYLYKLDKTSLRSGIYGYNGCLVGVGLATFLNNSIYLWIVIIFASILSVIATQSLSNFFKIWKLTPLTAPFVIVSWIILLSSYEFYSIKGIALPTPHNPIQYLNHVNTISAFSSLIPDTLRGLSEVFLFSNMVVGIIFLIGLAVNSISSASYALLGSFLSIVAVIFLQSDINTINIGLYSFSAVLTGIALGSIFNQPSISVTIYTIIGVFLTIFIQAALDIALQPIGIPTLTMPFVLATWFLLNSNKEFTATNIK